MISITRHSITPKHVETVYVDKQKQLEEVCALFAKAERLAVDTEFVGEKYYYPRLEVIQVTDGKTVALIDAPALDLAPLAKVLGDASKLKIFHASGQDLEILHRSLGVPTVPIFDTQVAASLLGQGQQISLSNLIRTVLNVDVSGKHTTSDWSHRPLSEDQLLYAAADVKYLHELHQVLEEELRKHGRLAWFEDEQTSRVKSEFAEEDAPAQELYRRVKDWMSLSGRELAVLQDLAIWRENAAREKNMPRRTVFTDEGLVELARFQPMTKDKAQKLRRINVGQLMKNFDEVKRCIERGRALPKEQWPGKPTGDRPDIPTGLLELCQALLRAEAERLQIAPTVLATTSELQRVINERDQIDALDIPLLQGWRRELAGGKIVDLLRGKVHVVVAKDGSLVFEDR